MSQKYHKKQEKPIDRLSDIMIKLGIKVRKGVKMATNYLIKVELTDKEKETGELVVSVATKGQMEKVAESLGKNRIKVTRYTMSEVEI